MERRKFIVGLGSLAAGTTVAVGSGAVSSQESPRAVDADVVNDTNGTIQFLLSAGSLENTEYAEIGGDGQLSLHFDGTANGGNGLNPDSEYYFDNVFQIQNATQDDLKVDIDKSGLDHPNAFTFYAHQTNGSLIGSRTSDWTGQANAGFGVNIGVRIVTPDSVPTDWETGQIVVTATDESDQNI